MADRRPLQILVIDDDPLILDLVELFLAEFSVTTARGGVRGRAMLETQRPTLVILDVAMPDLDGLSVLRWTRRPTAGQSPRPWRPAPTAI
jgi:DNA-binding response OmpR family regulator